MGDGRGVHNFVGEEGEERVRAGFAGRSHARLLAVKETWDPDDVFRGTHALRARR